MSIDMVGLLAASAAALVLRRPVRSFASMAVTARVDSAADSGVGCGARKLCWSPQSFLTAVLVTAVVACMTAQLCTLERQREEEEFRSLHTRVQKWKTIMLPRRTWVIEI